MKIISSTLLFAAAASLGCEAVSRSIGDLQTGNGEPIDIVALAIAICEKNCCGDPPLEDWELEDCAYSEYVDLLNTMESAANLGFWVDPECFAQLATCHEPSTGCETGCKLYFGSKGLGDACDAWHDDCGQGLVCQEYSVRRYDCGDPFGDCEEYATRCIDPCDPPIETRCRASDWPSLCGPDAYCDDVYLPDDYLDNDYGTCHPRPRLGESCSAQGAQCAVGTYCDASQTCVAPLAEGEPCNGNGECLTELCGPIEAEYSGGMHCLPPLAACSDAW